MYSGRALIATMTATFQAKVGVTTNERSASDGQILFLSSRTKRVHTEISRKERYADDVEEQSNNLRNHHINMPKNAKR